MNELPSAILPPEPKVVIHDLPGREIVGEQTPRTPTPQDIKDAIEDFALGILLRSAAGLRLGHMGLDQLPLFVTQVGRVRLSGSMLLMLTHLTGQLGTF